MRIDLGKTDEFSVRPTHSRVWEWETWWPDVLNYLVPWITLL